MVEYKKYPMLRLLTAAMSVVVFCTVLSAGLAAWWAWGPVDDPIIPVNISMHSAFYAGGDITVHREVMVTKNTDILVNRNLIMRDANDPNAYFGISLPTFRVHALAGLGVQLINRQFDVPYKLPPGRYELHSTVTYRANPMRDGVIKMPVVTVEVPN